MSGSVLAETITEREFQRTVMVAARLFGWRCYHTFDSRRSAQGFPDLVLVRPPRIVFVELKTTRGTASPSQSEWLDDLTRCGAEVHLWRPGNWQQVETTLR